MMIPARWFFFVPAVVQFLAAVMFGGHLVLALAEFNDPHRILVTAGLWMVTVASAVACCLVAGGIK